MVNEQRLPNAYSREQPDVRLMVEAHVRVPV